VGDSEVDLATARAAGIDCVSVTWGFRTSAQLREAGATVLVDTAEALGNWILSR
jgi:phosphoglycolate phosphatase